MKRISTIFAIALAVSVAGCSDHPLYPVASDLVVALTPPVDTLQAVGLEGSLVLTAHDGSGRAVRPQLLLWESSDPETVAVDQGGRVTALRNGDATITVRAGDAATATAAIVVDAEFRSMAWIRSIGNRDRNMTNNSDTMSVTVHVQH